MEEQMRLLTYYIEQYEKIIQNQSDSYQISMAQKEMIKTISSGILMMIGLYCAEYINEHGIYLTMISSIYFIFQLHNNLLQEHFDSNVSNTKYPVREKYHLFFLKKQILKLQKINQKTKPLKTATHYPLEMRELILNINDNLGTNYQK